MTRSVTATSAASKKEINDMLVVLKWSEATAGTVSEDEINNKDLLPSLTKANITKLCSITRKPGGGKQGHNVSMIAKDYLKLAVYWVQHQIRIS